MNAAFSATSTPSRFNADREDWVAVLNIRRFVLKLRPETVALYLLHKPSKYFRLIDRQPDYRAHS